MIDDLPDLKRRLRLARARALYWSGNPSPTGKRYSVRLNEDAQFEYTIAVAEVESLQVQIGKLTGVRPTWTEPKQRRVRV